MSTPIAGDADTIGRESRGCVSVHVRTHQIRDWHAKEFAGATRVSNVYEAKRAATLAPSIDATDTIAQGDVQNFQKPWLVIEPPSV